MKRSRKLKVPTDKVRELAEKFDERYAGNIADGMVLTAASGFWQTKAQGITARFVYRKGHPRDDGGRTTFTTVITGIRV